MQEPFLHNVQNSVIIELQSVDSTNNYALSLLKGDNLTERQLVVSHGLSVFAREQTQGKGQRGKKWHSNAGENIAVSIIIAPKPILLSSQFLLSAAVALGVASFLQKYIKEKVSIKWPNDIYIQDRKAGGILIENIINGMEWRWAVAGIGINVNQKHFDDSLPNPISLTQITGAHYDSLLLSKDLVMSVLNYIRYVKTDAATVINSYNEKLYRRGVPTKFKKDNRIFEAKVEKIDEAGGLILKHTIEERFEFGEIVWML